MVNEKRYLITVYPDDWDATENRNEKHLVMTENTVWYWINQNKEAGKRFTLHKVGDCLLDWS